MEVNGPANIKMLLQAMQMDIDECGHVTAGDMKKYLKALNDEVDLTISYMKKIGDVLDVNNIDKEIPFWHELKEEVKNED